MILLVLVCMLLPVSTDSNIQLQCLCTCLQTVVLNGGTGYCNLQWYVVEPVAMLLLGSHPARPWF